MAQRQRAGLITLRSYDRNVLPVSFTSPALQKLAVIAKRRQNTASYHRGGAEEARRAHNSEDVGSKPTSGIHHTSHWCIKALEHLITDMAQRQRARLITARTLDRDQLSVLITHRIGASRHWSNFQTPLAQRQSARLITARSGGSKPPGGIHSIRQLYRSWSS